MNTEIFRTKRMSPLIEQIRRKNGLDVNASFSAVFSTYREGHTVR